jgi:hypothetical protein
MAPGPSASKYLQRTASQPEWLENKQEQLLFATYIGKPQGPKQIFDRQDLSLLLPQTSHSNAMASILTIGVGVAAAAFLVRLHPINSINDTDSLAG